MVTGRLTRRCHGRERGQASVELVALLPALIVLGLIGWQLSVAAHAWLSAGGAARAAARAEAVGAPADRAARATLAPRYAQGSQVVVQRDATGARVRVSVEVPSVLPLLADAGRATATAPAVPTGATGP